MAEENQDLEEGKKNNTVPMIIMAIVGAAILGAGLWFMLLQNDTGIQVEEAPAEYLVQERLYQLRDGSYLRLSFSVVVDASHLSTVQQIIENESPGRLPDGVNMIVGAKTRKDLIEGTHKREAFVRELKKMLEERVFGDFNKRQISSKDMIEVREVLISNFVTQSG
ncbi:MAG: hypothetical protein CMO81_02660 [Waddliaceae bacterium]|nr:hypothetical protein [Waddliaceae bacterium]